eukprot:2726127-Pleurochrysis_carterae.AAC.1
MAATETRSQLPPNTPACASEGTPRNPYAESLRLQSHSSAKHSDDRQPEPQSDPRLVLHQSKPVSITQHAEGPTRTVERMTRKRHSLGRCLCTFHETKKRDGPHAACGCRLLAPATVPKGEQCKARLGGGEGARQACATLAENRVRECACASARGRVRACVRACARACVRVRVRAC